MSQALLAQLFGFSTLQRVEIAEIWSAARGVEMTDSFSTLQRVEIAEM